MDAKRIIQIIDNFIHTSPENSLKNETNEPAWEEALVGFSSGSDPIFIEFKEHVGAFHYTPEEIFNLTFADLPAAAAELTVIAWVLPQREVTKADNRAEVFYPSERWVRARFPGEDFNILLRKHLVEELKKENIQAVAPVCSPLWKMEMSPKYGMASQWSERHAAYASGLGTFGLCDGLITSKGKAHRVGSVVARFQATPTLRPYTDHHEYCLYFSDGSCMACAQRCPVGAITREGHNKQLCWDHAGVTCAAYANEKFGYKGYGCGLCQTGVPCENGIP